ncbi:hypothetical protein OROMI_009724 [Orobanche minor]
MGGRTGIDIPATLVINVVDLLGDNISKIVLFTLIVNLGDVGNIFFLHVDLSLATVFQHVPLFATVEAITIKLLGWLLQDVLWAKYENLILPNCSWQIFFFTTPWQIWNSRNERVFGQQDPPVDVVIFRIKKMADNWSRAFPKAEFFRKGGVQEIVKWRKPLPSWCKINTDGSSLSNTGSIACGGVLRNEFGDWIEGFSRKLQGVSINMAELMAIRQGLELAGRKRLSKVVIESDSEVIIKLIMSRNTSDHPLHNLLEDCRALMRRPWELELKHTKRGGNRCADFLAKLGHEVDGLRI